MVVTAAAAVEIAVPQVAVVDTIGAGDAFGGAFLARWIERGWGAPTSRTPPRPGRDDARHRGRGSPASAPGADPPRRDELGWSPVQP